VQSRVRYTIGSRHQWRQTLVLLLLTPLIASALFGVFLRSVGFPLIANFSVGLCFFVTALVALLWNGPESSGDQIARWLADITVNLAHGWAEDDGLHYQKWFRRRFVSWKGIARVEYWPDLHGRIELHLYSQRSPVVFVAPLAGEGQAGGVGAGQDGTASYIAQKLNQTWPRRSPFLISFQNTRRKGATIPRFLAGLSPVQKACANVFLMFLAAIGFYAYSKFYRAYLQQYWKVAAVIWVLILIGRFWSRLRRKSKIDDTRGTINAEGLGPTKKLN